MKIKKLPYRSPVLAIILSLLQIAIGGSCGILFTVFYGVSLFGGGSRVLLFWLALFTSILIWGIWNCVVSYRFYRLNKILLTKAKGSAITVGQLATELVCTPEKILADIHTTMAHRCWSGYGLTETTLVLVDASNNSGTILSDTEMEFTETPRRSPAGFILFLLVWLLYFAATRFVPWYHLIIAGFLSLGAFLVGSKIFPATPYVTQKERAEEIPYQPEPVETGNEETDTLMDEGLRHFSDLLALDKLIDNTKLDKSVRELTDITRQIFEFVKKTPEKSRQLRQFIKYYLPTTIKLLKNYEELERQPVKGENIKEAINRIEGIMDGILSTFRQQLDDLYRDNTMDISAEISVMENMMDKE